MDEDLTDDIIEAIDKIWKAIDEIHERIDMME